MGRTEFERKLIEDEGGLRTYLAGLREAAKILEDQEQKVFEMRQHLHQLIRDLVEKEGAPKALLARQVGLSPQRINSILHEQEAKTGKRKRS